MKKLAACFSFLLFALTLVHARSFVSNPQPLADSSKINTTRVSVASFKSKINIHNTTQKLGSCTYTVTFTTSCSSPSYTRDRISLVFGDAYGNEVYAPRLDDPSSGAFEACSVDTYEITGPCTYDICYLYVYRSGYDGWKLNTVQVYGYNTRAITFYYNTFIPDDVWYGFDYCNALSSSARAMKVADDA
ncbi:hypothetical protein NMG60_11004913 [Bertholletia excelsa]